MAKEVIMLPHFNHYLHITLKMVLSSHLQHYLSLTLSYHETAHHAKLCTWFMMCKVTKKPATVFKKVKT